MTAPPNTVRVWVTDVWDHVELEVSPEETFGGVKSRALTEATGRASDPADYHIKYRGALMMMEEQTLASEQVPSGAPMIVLPARRRPVV